MKENPDPSTWADLYADMLYRRALLLVDKPEIAEDLVQDTFLSAFQSFNSFQGKSSVKTWLTTILRNKVIDHLRKAINREVMTDFMEEPEDPDFNSWGIWKEYQQKWRVWNDNPEDILKTQELRKTLHSCLSKLPTNQRMIVKLRLIEGLELSEICKLLELSPSNISVLLFRARLGLRQCLDTNWFAKDQ